MCKDCSEIKEIYSDFIRWIKSHPIEISVVFFLIIAFITCCTSNISTLSALAAAAGLIFTALKYKLDQASYHKSLFDERLKVFNAINEALVSSGNKAEWHEINQKLTPVFNKSYFLFGHKTYTFITELSEQLITKTLESRSGAPSSITKGQIEKANTFLNNLLSERELAKKFPELKIDEY